jgi:hypothetical protein
MKKVVIIMSIVSFLSGCAPQQMYVRPGTTQAQFAEDRAQCMYEATRSTQNLDYSHASSLGMLIDQGMRRNELLGLCLQARGYKLEKVH